MAINNLSPVYLAIINLVLMILVFRVGRFIDKRGKIKYSWKPHGLGAIGTSSLGLLALLMGFTFSAVISRHDDRRKIIVQEANNIGTAILRADLYDDTNRLAFRNDFREYVEARIKYFKAGNDDKKVNDALEEASIISSRIWQRTMALSKEQKYFVPTMQMVPALNAMIDIVATRDAIMHARLDIVLLITLGSILQFGAFLIGVTSLGEPLEYLSFICFSVVASFAFLLIIDLDRPEKGVVKLNRAEQKIEALKSMFTVNNVQ